MRDVSRGRAASDVDRGSNTWLRATLPLVWYGMPMRVRGSNTNRNGHIAFLTGFCNDVGPRIAQNFGSNSKELFGLHGLFKYLSYRMFEH